MAVQDAAYLVAVPNICPEVLALRHNPYFFYFWDKFQKPYPLQVDIALSMDDVMDKKWEMIHCHESQVYEWIPYIEKMQEPVPEDEQEKRNWLCKNWGPFVRQITETCRPQLIERYGKEKGCQIEYAECFEICEYGSKPDKDDLTRLFPFE